jgi:hypothetical protein
MIEIIDLTLCDGDIGSSVRLKVTGDSDVRGLYQYVKERAIEVAETEMLKTQGRRMYLVEMGENDRRFALCVDVYK